MVSNGLFCGNRMIYHKLSLIYAWPGYWNSFEYFFSIFLSLHFFNIYLILFIVLVTPKVSGMYSKDTVSNFIVFPLLLMDIYVENVFSIMWASP